MKIYNGFWNNGMGSKRIPRLFMTMSAIRENRWPRRKQRRFLCRRRRNRLVAVADRDINCMVTQTVTYTYDAANRRITKTVDADGGGPAPEVQRRQ